ncbi:MAG: hypothetical protein LUD51_07900 [Clostridia bacterium]|nr:hypothetical protein [Clostridia bacterium]
MKPKACRVIIEGEHGCETRGLLHDNAEDGSFKVSFRYEGDSVDVELVPGGVHYARRGRQYVDVVYAAGKWTLCRIGTGPLAGEFEVYTERADIARNNGRTELEVVYSSGAPAKEKYTVKMSICVGE